MKASRIYLKLIQHTTAQPTGQVTPDFFYNKILQFNTNIVLDIYSALLDLKEKKVT